MNTLPRAFLFLADGFEITEAMAPADILVRGGVELNLISISDSLTVTSAQRISVNADCTLEQYSLEDIRKSNLAACTPLMNKMQRHFAEGGKVAAICAAPGFVLSQLPLEEVIKANGGLRMASYEGCENPLLEKGVTVIDPRQGVIADSNIISASGPGHAVAFGLKILEHIAGSKTADTVAKALML